MRRRPPSRRSRDEEGGVTLTVAVTMVVLLGIASFAVDLGMQRVSRVDMQAIADVVALDLARELDGRTRTEITADPGWAAARAGSVARNTDTFGTSLSVTAEPGVFDPVTRTVDTTSSEPSDAVLVTASSSVDYVLREGTGDVSRTAIAQSAKSACFALGSFAGRFRSGDAALVATLLKPMNAFLRPQANLDAASYQGLAVAGVTLNELAVDSNVGTVNDLLTASVSVERLVRAAIGALQRQTPQNTVAISALTKVLNGQSELATPVLLSEVVSISPTDSAALDTRLNVLDLIAGAVLLADGEHAVDVPNLSANIGNLAPVSSTLRVVQQPQTACGSDQARSSQLVGEVVMKLQLPSINGITGVQGVVHTPESAVRLQVELGHGTGRVTDPGPTCAAGTMDDPDTVPVAVQSGLTGMHLETTLRFSVAKLSVAGLGLVDVTFDQRAVTTLGMPDTLQTAALQVPPNDTVPVTTGSAQPLGQFTVSQSATNVQATLAGIPLSGVSLGLVENALAGVTSQLAVDTDVTGPLNAFVPKVNNLLTPLRTLLGLHVGGADVYAVGRPTCNGSALRG